MCVTRLFIWNRFGSRVTFALWDLLICMSVDTQNNAMLRTYRERVTDRYRMQKIISFHLVIALTDQGREPSY